MDLPPARHPVLAISSNKGGVGKTTVVTNLAVYLRALHEDLGVLLVGLDDQSVIDRMFRLNPAEPGEQNLKHGWAQRNLAPVLQMGQYGIHFVPTPPDSGPLKTRASDKKTLRHILDRTAFQGLTILDTKSDLELLTQNALVAADLVILPVSDWASLEEAEKAFGLLRLQPGGERRGRILFTLVDRRTRVDSKGRDLYDRLARATDERGWPRFQGFLSRSPRVEALNSGTGKPGSVLHHARGTAVHRQMRELAEEVTKLLALGSPGPVKLPPERAVHPRTGLGAGLKRALLMGLGSR
ncbi:MAG: ParA family protein [bacterium]|nr:ParA family protein [bacterium]MCP5066735.1 ParA family protein [bacterium]